MLGGTSRFLDDRGSHGNLFIALVVSRDELNQRPKSHASCIHKIATHGGFDLDPSRILAKLKTLVLGKDCVGLLLGHGLSLGTSRVDNWARQVK